MHIKLIAFKKQRLDFKWSLYTKHKWNSNLNNWNKILKI